MCQIHILDLVRSRSNIPAPAFHSNYAEARSRRKREQTRDEDDNGVLAFVKDFPLMLVYFLSVPSP